MVGLIYSNSMALYVLTNFVTFLTHIWKLKLKHVVAIMNIKGGAAGIIGLVEAALIDAYLGHAGMLLITSVLYSIGEDLMQGLRLLVMSVSDRFFSNGVKSCPAGEKLCSSKLTASPFYWGLALIVLAKAGQEICLKALTFGKIKFKRGPPETKVIKFVWLQFEVCRREIRYERKRQKNIIQNTCNIVGTAGGITLVSVLSIVAPNWSHRFLISAYVMAIGIVIFFSGYAFLSSSQLHLDFTKQGTEFNNRDEDQTPQRQGHNQKTPQGPKKRTTLTDHCRWWWPNNAAINVPRNFYYFPDGWINCTVDEVEETKLLLRMVPISVWLNNAAINMPRNFCYFPDGWINCTIDEVEETKLLLRMVPISATFPLYGVIKSNSNTFFIPQGNEMDSETKLLLRMVPIAVTFLLYGEIKSNSNTFFIAQGNAMDRWLNNAAINMPRNFCYFPDGWINCTMDEVEETKLLLRMLPISATFPLYGVIKYDSNTFFIAQGNAMDRWLNNAAINLLLRIVPISATFLWWWLNNVAINVPRNFCHFPDGWINCPADEVQETKLLLRMVPISATFLLYGVIKSNSNTFFIAQGNAMDR
ncbi:unnamed protein product [Camellia sinensis]